MWQGIDLELETNCQLKSDNIKWTLVIQINTPLGQSRYGNYDAHMVPFNIWCHYTYGAVVHMVPFNCNATTELGNGL